MAALAFEGTLGRRRAPLSALLLLSAAAFASCARARAGAEPPATSAEADPGEGEGEGSEDLDESMGARSDCRTGRVPIPESDKALRAVADDARGYAVLLPDLPDWAMACGDGPFLIAEAMGGAVSATVYATELESDMEPQDFLDRFGDQLEADLARQGLGIEERALERSEAGHWNLTFRVETTVEGVERWQFNFITARRRGARSYMNLQLTVTALNDGSSAEQTRSFAKGLERYLDLFRLTQDPSDP